MCSKRWTFLLAWVASLCNHPMLCNHCFGSSYSTLCNHPMSLNTMKLSLFWQRKLFLHSCWGVVCHACSFFHVRQRDLEENMLEGINLPFGMSRLLIFSRQDRLFFSRRACLFVGLWSRLWANLMSIHLASYCCYQKLVGYGTVLSSSNICN